MFGGVPEPEDLEFEEPELDEGIDAGEAELRSRGRGQTQAQEQASGDADGGTHAPRGAKKERKAARKQH